MEERRKIKLPRFVAIMGYNGKYVRAEDEMGTIISLNFSGNDFMDPKAVHEVFTNDDGWVRLMNIHYHYYWAVLLGNTQREAPNRVVLDPKVSENDPRVWFLPLQLRNTVIALPNKDNGLYCSCHDLPVFADAHRITQKEELKVREVVLSREIDNVIFDIQNARIYDVVTKDMDSKEFTNSTTEPMSVVVKFFNTESKSTTWKAKDPFKIDTLATITANIPEISNGEIILTPKVTITIMWGHTYSKPTPIENEFIIKVLPKHRDKVTLRGTQGTCDVPFSYTQHDIFPNKVHATSTLDDGIFTGTNWYNFTSKTEQMPL